MKTLDIVDATAPLAEYASHARKRAIVVTRRGKPLAALIPLDSSDWEDFVVSQDPGFVEVLRRSQARYLAEGGISLEEMRRRHAPRRRAPRSARRSAR